MSATQMKRPNPEVLSDAELATIAKSAQTRIYSTRTVIVSEGDKSDALYVIAEGRCRAFVSDADGREAILADLGPGEYFGEVAMDEGTRSASVITLEPAKLYVVTAERFRAFLAENPDFAFHFIRKLLHRIRSLTRNVSNLALLDVYGRVAKLFTDAAVVENGRSVMPERMTQTEIASLVGSSRETVGRILDDLVQGGYLALDKDRIVILRTPPAKW
jgi:CRP/FNR family transcriptional regulator, cyclic AMP receptor protein